MSAPSGQQRVHASASAAPSRAASYPAAFSWVDKGKVSSVKDQGFDCASCWAFAAAATMESAFAIASSLPPMDLSPQSLVDCFTQFAGCKGGRQPVRVGRGEEGRAASRLLGTAEQRAPQLADPLCLVCVRSCLPSSGPRTGPPG